MYTNKTGLYDEGIILCIKLARSSYKSFKVGFSAIMCKQAPARNSDMQENASLSLYKKMDLQMN